MKRVTLSTIAAMLAAAAVNTAVAGISYWDPNGTSLTTTGTDTHSWEGTLWTGTTTRTASTVAFTEGNLPGFVANPGTLVINATYNVVANSSHSIGGIFNGGLTDGCVTNLQISGTGTLNVASGFQGFTVGTSGNTTVNNVLGGSGGVQWEGGGGSLYFWAANTYTGNTWLNTFNGLNFNNGNAFGTGYITNYNTAHLTVLSTPTTDGGGTANGASSPLTVPNDFWMDGSASSKLIFVPGSGSAPTTFSGNWHCNLASGTVTLDFRAPSSTVQGKTVISGVISGTVAYLITNAAPGTGGVIFAGNNTYTGITTVGAASSGATGTSNSVLQIGNGGTTGSFGTGNVTDNGVIVINRSDSPTIGNVISGSGVVIFTNSSGATLTGANTYTGGTYITSGATLNIGNGGAGGLGNGAITNNGTLAFNSTGNTSSSGIVSGPGNITKAGTGTLTLSGANTFTGKVSVTGGTLSLNLSAGGDSALGATPGSYVADQLTLDGGTLTCGSAGTPDLAPTRGVTLGVGGGTISTGASKGYTIEAPIVGPGSLTRSQSATGNLQAVTLTGASTYSGGLTITGGRINMNNSSAAGVGPTITINPAGVVNVIFATSSSTDITITNNISVVNNGFQVDVINTGTGSKFNLNGIISGTGALARGVNGGASQVVLNGANTFSGGFTNAEGPTILGNKSALGTGLFTIAPKSQSATLTPMIGANTDLTGANAVGNAVLLTNGTAGANFNVIGANDLEFSGPVTLGASPVITNNSTGKTIFSGNISESVGFVGAALTNAGTGTTVISGTGSYTGPTDVESGTLQVDGNIASSSSLTVNGGTLKGNGVVPATTVNNGGTVNPGASPGTLTVNNGITFAAGSTNVVEINDFAGTAGSNPGWDLINANSLTISGAVTFKVNSLNGTSSGAAANFSNSTDYDLTIIHATNGFSGGDLSTVTLDTTDFAANNTLDAGGLFRVVAVTNLDNSVDVVLQYRRAAVITVQPVATTVCPNATANFNVTATGSSTITYQWQKGGVNLSNGSQPSGATVTGSTSANLTIAGAQVADSDNYSVIVTAAVGSAATSSAASLTVPVAPVIATPAAPSTTAVDAGTTQNLSVTTSAGTALTYQWQKGGVALANGIYDNGAAVSGATTPNLTLTDVRASDSADYTCLVSTVGACSSAISPAQTLVVNDPVITVQPVNSTFECGTSNALTVTAVGTTNANGVLTYQWYTPDPSGTAITDATNSFLSFPTNSFMNAGSYSVVVSNALGNFITSSVVVVTIEDTNGPVITVNPGASSVECHTSYTDAGATALDSCDGSVSVTTSGLPDVNTTGNYVVTYTATDSHGNSSTATRAVAVNDTTAPVITVTGSDVTISCGVAYTDSGATATDTCAGDLTSQISVDLGGLNPASPVGGVYTITYTVSDPSLNAATPKTRTVTVIDNIPPVVTLIGASEVTNECHTAFADPGATANDGCAGDVTSRIQVVGNLDTNTVNVYTLTYVADDGSGNTNATVTRIVHVTDTVSPVIALIGDASVTNECHVAFADPGATVSDDCDTNPAVATNSTVNVNLPGVYAVTYTVTDASGNSQSVTRQVTVQDSIAPAITVLGDNPAQVECHTSYTDAGATVSDACDSNPSLSTNNPVNPNSVGIYTVTYSAQDAAGNPSSATRVVNVVDSAPPVVTVTGPSTVTVECHSAYTELGATVTDTCDAAPALTTNGVVDVNTPNTYTVTYSAVDATGNQAAQTRLVIVSDTQPPVMSLNGSADVTVECHSAYTELGATAHDACEGDIVPTISGDTVDTNTVANYTITYSACDTGGHCSNLTRVVHVIDDHAPSITLNGTDPMTNECHTAFVDPKGSVADDCDSQPTLTVSGDVDTNTPSQYTLTYLATDAQGNTATITRVVVVADTIAPVVTPIGGDLSIECHGGYTDGGATATDDCAGDLTDSITTVNPVDPDTLGIYTVTYTVSDPAGNPNTAYRVVTVQDTTKPDLVLNGNSVTNICYTHPYNEEGAIASDTCAGDLTTNVVITGGPVDTGTIGTYVLTYSVTDAAGNLATATRTVNVEACEAIITNQPIANANLNANDTLTLQVGAVAANPITYQWTHNGNTITNANDSTYTVAHVLGADAGTYTVLVSAGNTVESSEAHVTVVDPYIQIPPGDDAVTVGVTNKYTFSVTALGTGPLKYQWSFNGTPISKATNSFYKLSTIATSKAGDYSVVVHNGLSSVSATAHLTVHGAWKVNNPASVTKVEGDNAMFTTLAKPAAEGPFYYQWNLNNTPLVESAHYVGVTTPTLTVIGCTLGVDGGNYTCLVTNASATNHTTKAAVLTVLQDTKAPAVAILSPKDKAIFTGTNGTMVEVSGKAVDKGKITQVVLFQNNDGGTASTLGYQVDSKTNTLPWKVLWTNEVALVSGTNTFIASAWDASTAVPGGNRSNTKPRTLFLLTPTNFTLVPVGPGKVAGKNEGVFGFPKTNADNTPMQLNIGIGYTVAAHAATKKTFDGWFDDNDNPWPDSTTVNKTSPFTFVMPSTNLVLKAKFH